MTELKVGGPREAVTVEEAEKVRKRFEEIMARDDAVTKVDVSCRQWSADSVKVLRPVLEKAAPTVMELDLADIIAGLETSSGLKVMELFGDIFRNVPKVKVIDLSDNAMGPRALEKIEPALKAPQLVEIFLNNCGLSAETIPQLDNALMVDGLGVARLSALSLDQNMIGVEGARQIGLLLPACKKLEHFSYCGCRPESGGSKLIATGLRGMAENNDNHNLVRLMLEDCTLGSGEEEDDAIHDLTKALEKMPHMSHLNLKDGDIEENGMGMLAQALINSGCKLASLDLGACALGPDGAESLQELVKANVGTLNVLRLETNEMENDGIEKVLSVFCDDTNVLTDLWLDENDLGEGIIAAILACSFPKLQKLSLKDNPDLEELDDDKKESIRSKFSNTKIYFDEEDDDGDDGQQGDVAVDNLAAAMAGLQT